MAKIFKLTQAVLAGIIAGGFAYLILDGLIETGVIPAPPQIVFYASVSVSLVVAAVSQWFGMDLFETFLLAATSSVVWTVLLNLPGPLEWNTSAGGWIPYWSFIIALVLSQMLGRTAFQVARFFNQKNRRKGVK